MIPEHIGYIVDGNRRWAKARGLSTEEGHKKGFDALKDVVDASFDKGIKIVSAFIFSTENWDRSVEEVGYLMRMFENYFDKEVKKLHEKNIRVVFLGNRTQNVRKRLVTLMEKGEKLTQDNTRGTLALCFNYGGHLEIAEACQKIIASGVPAEEVTPEVVEQNLYHPELPPVDMVVRTSGEERISNFMLWRIAYAEMMWVEKCFPDMTPDDVDDILTEYASRNRRHGK